MDTSRLEAIPRSLTGYSCRRNVLRGLAAAERGLTAFPGWTRNESVVAAKKKGKHKRKKDKRQPQLLRSPPPGHRLPGRVRARSGLCSPQRLLRAVWPFHPTACVRPCA
jgi:hypothetical protein